MSNIFPNFSQTMGKSFVMNKGITLLCNFISVTNSTQKILSRHYAQCGKFRIFLPIRFYVKSILNILGVQKLPFLQFQRPWILFLVKFSPQKLQEIIKNWIQSFKNVKTCIFWTFGIPKRDFTYILSGW